LKQEKWKLRVRAKFVVEVPAASPASFPSNEDLESRLFALGLAEQGHSADFDTRQKRYVSRADEVWGQFPEVAQDERDYVVFFARLPFHSKLIVTRFEEGTAVFRVLNEDLAKLEDATARLVDDITSKAGALNGLEIVSNEVEVYERQTDRVVIRGYVVSKPLREALRRNSGTAITLVVTGIAALVTMVILGLHVFRAGTIPVGTIERFSTAMLATFFVSLATFIQVWISLRRKRHIDWQAVSSTS